MANSKGSALPARGTPDRANDGIYVFNGGSPYQSTVNNELGITGAPVGTTDSQTLTNKTLTSPAISGPTLSGTLTGTYTLGGTPTFPASVVTLTGSQTLTNKVLTSPTINSPTITNASITADAITGFSTANTGSVYGLSVVAGALASGSVNYAQLLSTIFSGQVTSSANVGTGLGTIYKVNLGGIKLMWGISSAQTVNTNNTFGFTLPAFFTTVQTCFNGNVSPSGVNYSFVVSFSTTTVSVQLQSVASISCQAEFFMIGT